MTYSPIAFDAEGDVLSFDLPVLPIGMGIDPVTGVIVWTPSAEQVDQTFDVVLRVRDAFGGLDLQPFSIKVAAANSPPEFMTVAPAGPAVVAKPYRYNARAYDPNGDAVRYTLDAASIAKGIAINLTTGVLTWTPASGQTGSHTIVITADDLKPGGQTTQSFNLSVVASCYRPNYGRIFGRIVTVEI